MTVPQLPGESGTAENAGLFAREVTVTDRRIHLPFAALVLTEEAQMLSEYHQSVAEQARTVRDTEMRHRQQILSEARELERCLLPVKNWTDRHWPGNWKACSPSMPGKAKNKLSTCSVS